jgi:two-component system, OmpR family, sensor kinase
MHGMHRVRRPRTLSSRLFSWFFGAILLAIVTSALVVGTTRAEPVGGVESIARHMASRLAADWDDPEAVRGDVDQVRDVTGLDVRLVRDARRLPAHVHRVAERGGSLAPGALERVFIPVVRGGELIGALEMDRAGGGRPSGWSWGRLALALAAVMAVLSVMAGRVANLLARPLERLALAADRLGGGDLASRADVARAPGWVALEVRDLAVSFNRMADRVETMVRGQRELLGAISHELRSPLGRAHVALEIARDRLPEASPPGRAAGHERAPEQAAARALDDVETQLAALDAVLADLLDLTRAGLADLDKETRDVAGWLRARAAAEPTPPVVLVRVAPDAEHLAVPFDAALLGRALHNLVANAVNAQARGDAPDRPISLTLTRTGDNVRIVVRDHGPGFPEGFTERAFEPFVRGDPARARPTVGAGYGLGLTIVRRIVEAHGGRAFARNHAAGEAGAGAGAAEGAGAGAEVGFDLPIAPRPR